MPPKPLSGRSATRPSLDDRRRGGDARRRRSAGWPAVAPTGAVIPSATTAPCPDIEVIFARGTHEPAGVGTVGQAFVDALRPQVGGRTVSAYGVTYPASYDFLAAGDGAFDASARAASMASSCPDTRLVLGGYSQGAAVVDILAGVPSSAAISASR